MELNPLYSPDVGTNEELNIEKVNENHTGDQKSSYSPESKSKFVCLFVLFAIIQSTFRLFKGQQY